MTDEVPKISRRNFLKTLLKTAAITTAIELPPLAYGVAIEPDNLDIANVELTLPRLAPEFDGYRVVQISDIHMGVWMNPEKLQTIVDTINQQEPDAVAITGDFVTEGNIQSQYDRLVTPLSNLKPKDVTVATLGNHDHWTEAEVIYSVIRDSGIQDVNNGVVTIERDGALFHLAGVDDIWMKKNDLDKVLEQLPDEGSAMLLAHEPDYADASAESGRFDLQISGHSHGGQFMLPFIGPPVRGHLGKKYPVGAYQIRNMIQYTNRGVGMIVPYIRINCPPEITIFTLRSPNM